MSDSLPVISTPGSLTLVNDNTPISLKSIVIANTSSPAITITLRHYRPFDTISLAASADVEVSKKTQDADRDNYYQEYQLKGSQSAINALLANSTFTTQGILSHNIDITVTDSSGTGSGTFYLYDRIDAGTSFTLTGISYDIVPGEIVKEGRFPNTYLATLTGISDMQSESAVINPINGAAAFDNDLNDVTYTANKTGIVSVEIESSEGIRDYETSFTIKIGSTPVLVAKKQISTTARVGSGEYILTYGTTSGASIVGGTENVYSDGKSISAKITGGGIQVIASGGQASSAVITTGSQYVQGGNAVRTVVQSGGCQIVLAGVVENTNVYSGGSQILESGGKLQNTTIHSGGVLEIARHGSGGVGIVISSGGTLKLNPHTYITGTTIVSGGGIDWGKVNFGDTNTIVTGSGPTGLFSISGDSAYNVPIHGAMIMGNNSYVKGAIVESGELSLAYTGAHAENTIIKSGASLVVSGGTLAENTTVNGGTIVIYGGTVKGATINSGGSLKTNYPGVASSINLTAGSWFNNVEVGSGGQLKNFTYNGLAESRYRDSVNITSNVMASNLIIHSNAASYTGYGIVKNGGIATGTQLDGGQLIIDSGGKGINTKILSGGKEWVERGAISSNTVIESGGMQDIAYAGLATNATINAGGSQVVSGSAHGVSLAGVQYVSSGGKVTGARVWKTGSQYIYSGGVDSGAIVNGTQVIDYKGQSINAAINPGATQIVSSGGSAVNTGLSGKQNINTGGIVTGAKIYVKGEQQIFAGATVAGVKANGKQSVHKDAKALGGVFNKGAVQNIEGTGSGAIIAGTQNIRKGGIATADKITGVQNIEAGGLAINAIISKGGRQQVNGSARNASVAGMQLIGNGGTVTGAKVWATGNQTVQAGGTETGTIVNGAQIINAGGKSFNAAINQVATQRIYGAAKNTGLSGKQYVYAGAAVTQAKIYLKGVQYIQSGATVTGAKATGRQIVNAGASAVSGVFNKGARQDVYGTATGTVVAGIQNIYSGGTAQNGSITATGKINVMAGGKLNVTSNMTAAGQINLTGATITGAAGRQLALSTTSYLAMGAGNKISNIGVNAAGRVLINGANNSMQSLTTGATTTTTFDLRNLSASTTPLLKVAAKTTLNGTAAVQVKTGQRMGVYTLGANLSRSASVGLNVDGKGITKIGVGRAYAYNGVNYLVANSGQNLTLTLSLARGAIYTAANSLARSVSPLSGTSLSDIFIAGQGNDVISGNGGRDVAVYGAEKWGRDIIEKTNGTMTLCFRDLKSSDIRQTMDGKDMILQKAGNSGDEIRVKDWNSATHNVVFGGTMGELSRYAAAANPTAAQANAASNEVWKKSGLLA